MPPAQTQAATPGAEPFAGGSAAGNELNELFYAANATERRLILFNLDYAPLMPAKPIAAQIASEATRRLEAAALSHNTETFVRELARVLGISPEQGRRLAGDQSGEPLVIAARALAMPAHVLQRVLAVSESSDWPVGATGL